MSLAVKAKSYLNSSFALNLDTSTKVAALLVQFQLDDLGVDYISRRQQLIASVTLDDAKRVAKRLLDGGLLVTVVGKPDRRGDPPVRPRIKCTLPLKSLPEAGTHCLRDQSLDSRFRGNEQKYTRSHP